jgi:hypothetical protein
VTEDRDGALFECIVFLATAARGTLEEGVFTASFRLVDAIRRLLAMFPGLAGEPFFAALSDIIDRRFRTAYHQSEAEYVKVLDDILETAAREIRRRCDLDPV